MFCKHHLYFLGFISVHVGTHHVYERVGQFMRLQELPDDIRSSFRPHGNAETPGAIGCRIVGAGLPGTGDKGRAGGTAQTRVREA